MNLASGELGSVNALYGDTKDTDGFSPSCIP